MSSTQYTRQDSEAVAVLMPVGTSAKPEKKPAPTKADYKSSLAAIGSWSDLDLRRRGELTQCK